MGFSALPLRLGGSAVAVLVPILLTALEKGQIETASIEIVARTRLMEDSDSAIAGRAKAIFQNQNSDRAKVVAEFHDVLKLNGDTGRGKKLFDDNCAKYHLPRRDRAPVRRRNFQRDSRHDHAARRIRRRG